MRNWISFLVAFIVVAICCAFVFLSNKSDGNFQSFTTEQVHSYELPYDLDNPDRTYKLPSVLKEISALSYYGNNRVLTVNDEEGTIYIFDFEEAEVVSTIDIGKRGDYESIARYNNTAYVFESNGNLKVIDLEKGLKVNDYNTILSSRNDVEGLCLDRAGNRLLVACKGELEEKSKNKHEKGIYSFDLRTNTLKKEAFKIIDLSDAYKELGFVHPGISSVEVYARLKDFAPSAIAINPISSNIYMLSSRGKLLVVMSPEKDIISINLLSKRLYGQPEGLTFDERGTLYISNEGKSGPATINQLRRITN